MAQSSTQLCLAMSRLSLQEDGMKKTSTGHPLKGIVLNVKVCTQHLTIPDKVEFYLYLLTNDFSMITQTIPGSGTLSFQTSLHKLSVKLVQMFIVKSASPPNIGKVLENDMQSDP